MARLIFIQLKTISFIKKFKFILLNWLKAMFYVHKRWLTNLKDSTISKNFISLN